MNPLIQALMQAMHAQQPSNSQKPGIANPRHAALARAMAGRASARVDPKWASLAALKPYGESDHADQFGGAPGAPQGAFQTSAFENDAFQVDGVV